MSGADGRWQRFDEGLEVGLTTGLRIGSELYRETSAFYDLAIYETTDFGRALVMDNIIQTTERDEFVYHEMLTHTPIFAHGGATDVLIIGGGDGGMLEEVLKHRSVRRATMVEIDGHVVDLCRKYIPGICGKAFEDPRTDLVIADGAAYVRDTDARFDVIIIDSPDPMGPAKVLFEEPFYMNCKRVLRPGGVVVRQNGIPLLQTDELEEAMTLLGRHFADVACYMATVPTYTGAHMAFGWASDDPAKRAVEVEMLARRHAASGIATRYWSPTLHRGAFAVPAYVEAVVEKARRR